MRDLAHGHQTRRQTVALLNARDRISLPGKYSRPLFSLQRLVSLSDLVGLGESNWMQSL